MLTAKHGDHEDSPDDHSPPTEEMVELEQYLQDNFKQFVIAASQDGNKVMTGGSATAYSIIVFSLAILKKAHYQYKVDGLFDLNSSITKGIRKHLELAMSNLREVRVLSHRALAQSRGEEDIEK